MPGMDGDATLRELRKLRPDVPALVMSGFSEADLGARLAKHSGVSFLQKPFTVDSIREDPATGSANGCLAAYLLQHGFLGTGDVDIRVGQGYEVARPSRLHLRASRDDTGFRIDVGGRVRVVAEGEWQLEA